MKNDAAQILDEVLADTNEVVETAKRVQLFTTKRLIVAGAVVVAVTGTVLIFKKVRAAKDALAELEEN